MTTPDPVTEADAATEAESPFAPATDVHVHLMPPRLMAAIRDALHEQAGWTFDYPVERDAMEAVLRAQGVERYVALPYAHRPGMARELNEWVLERAADSELCVPFATVHGEDDVRAVVRDAFGAGARGLKFQCPVQGCGPADPRLDPAFELAAEFDRPVLFHAGTAPFYRESDHVGADQFASFLDSYPEVRACSAHMGAYEVDAFLDLLREHDTAFLDTTFTMSAVAGDYLDFDPASVPDDVFEAFAGRIMYGSDFPNAPYAYEEERAGLLERELSDEAYDGLFRGAAERFLGLE